MEGFSRNIDTSHLLKRMKKGRVCGSEDQWFHHKKHYGVVRGM